MPTLPGNVESVPNKKGFIDECSECVGERYKVAPVEKPVGEAGPVKKMGQPYKSSNRAKKSFRRWTKSLKKSKK